MAWAPDYATTEELAAYVSIPDDADDVQLAGAIAAASRAIDQATGRQFGQLAVPEARIFPAELDCRVSRWFVRIDDLMVSPTAVATDPDADGGFTGDVGTGFTLGPVNAASQGRPWDRLDITSASSYYPGAPDRYVRVTALWGWSAVPPAISQATLLQAARVFKRRVSPFGIAGPTADSAPTFRLLSRLDPDVEVMVRPYRRTWGFVA